LAFKEDNPSVLGGKKIKTCPLFSIAFKWKSVSLFQALRITWNFLYRPLQFDFLLEQL
jgi:hypothetical protein